MSTYLDMKKPKVETLPSPPAAMTMRRRLLAVRLRVTTTLLTLFRPLIGGRPPVARRPRRPAASVW